MKLDFYGQCRICGRGLKNNESVRAGIGPICANKDRGAGHSFPGDEAVSELMFSDDLEQREHELLRTSYWASVRLKETGDIRYERMRDDYWRRFTRRAERSIQFKEVA